MRGVSLGIRRACAGSSRLVWIAGQVVLNDRADKNRWIVFLEAGVPRVEVPKVTGITGVPLVLAFALFIPDPVVIFAQNAGDGVDLVRHIVEAVDANGLIHGNHWPSGRGGAFESWVGR